MNHMATDQILAIGGSIAFTNNGRYRAVGSRTSTYANDDNSFQSRLLLSSNEYLRTRLSSFLTLNYLQESLERKPMTLLLPNHD
ncbi:hypothetical protein V1478_015275 [Vespula squamosa]|uniref:Uncharacterized protein n=1 Tax=Vespula squamosa TaxID=30214 RepID=A0ABD2A4M3_VESSQ